ncbi:MAG: hypothetical protein U0359_24480 [Byssovorax sp.]
MAPRASIDPVLAALQRAPVVPLTEHEMLLLAALENEPERRIPYADVATSSSSDPTLHDVEGRA